MTPVTIIADVQDLSAPQPALQLRRVVGKLDDQQTIVVATMTSGESTARAELSFRIDEAAALAHACLAGNRRALTTPGLARILSSTVALLLRVSLASGGLQQSGGFLHDGHDDGGDRAEAAADEADG